MKKMSWVMSAAMVSVWAVGCGGQELESAETARVAAELTDGNKLFGSDTLKSAFIGANTAASAGLSIQGLGSGVGEGCMRAGSGTSCVGRQQAISPMSRDFKAGTCANGSASTGACCAGEQSNVIALDAVNAWVSASNATTNLTKSNLKALFCGPAGDGLNCAATTWVKYRRDDASGTTDTFKSLVGCTAFCPDVKVVVDGANAALFTDPAHPTPCSASDSATSCIGKITASTDTTLSANAIGYAGDSAKQGTANKALSVDGIAPTAANVRKLISAPATAYPLARKLFLNENVNFTKDPKEATLYNWIYNNKQSFQNLLTGQGFISCDTTGPLKCGGPNNDGKKAGACQGI
ncbi:cell envelope biogenesis protein OmpA [Archangium violaceum]|uniref:substrate-binding domain-containing protein n=1 Tax=Archangium violaceum TaxID=83451 RepID=UPI0019518619|nr:substrate-binding domain-containing protein [Archangium violaceum]QRN94857.1 cell envelope biogenesis protein OmpA [Archangium violaceum]